MTATTEATTTTLPDREVWRNALAGTNGDLYRANRLEETTDWFMNKARQVNGSLEGLTAQDVASEYALFWNDFPSWDSGYQDRLWSLLEDVLLGSDNESAQDATPAGEETPAMVVEKAIAQTAEGIWDSRRLNYGDQGADDLRQNMAEVLVYIYGNWKRGIRLRASDNLRWEQFKRRYDRSFDENFPSDYEVQMRQILRYLHDNARGVAADLDLIKPYLMSGRNMRITFEREQPGFAVDSLGTSTSSYVADALRGIIYPITNGGAARGRERSDIADWKADTSAFVDALNYQSSYLGSAPLDQREVILEFLQRWALPSGSALPQVTEIPTDTEDAFFGWLLARHENLNDFRVSAVTNGWQDWMDTLKAEGKFPDSTLADALRRCVRQYGFTRFTGRTGKMTLESALTVIADRLRDKGLTTEEWKARWTRRDLAISYVSGRYGEENDMCKVLEKATTELGILPVRKPKQMFSFKGSGVIAQIEVETWKDDDAGLRGAARSTWNAMTAQQRLDAVIDRTDEVLSWDSMSAII